MQTSLETIVSMFTFKAGGGAQHRPSKNATLKKMQIKWKQKAKQKKTTKNCMEILLEGLPWVHCLLERTCKFLAPLGKIFILHKDKHFVK